MDGTVADFFGVDPSVPMVVKLKTVQLLPVHVSVLTVRLPKLGLHKMRLAVSTVIPLMKRLMKFQVEIYFVIDVTKEGASLKPVQYGMDGGYG
ncbi:hypothetical protein NXV51_00680 [Bacteroides uniformis]|nr:hypothetical protein [Bacteroides uniformis]